MNNTLACSWICAWYFASWMLYKFFFRRDKLAAWMIFHLLRAR